MGIYNYILKVNRPNQRKRAVSITMDSGEVIRYTYGELFEQADCYATKLKEMGVRAGDRIIIAAENAPEWQMAFLAIMKLKATAVLLDASLGGEDLKKLIIQSDARAIYTSVKVKEKIGESTQFRVPVLCVTEDGKPFADSYKVLSPFVEKTLDPDTDIAVIIYSSGTTRAAAGIMHTHDALIHTIRMTAKENELTSDERILSILPNSHIYGVITCLLGSMMLGASVHYVESISSENILSAFKTFKPTVFPSVPKMLELFEKQIMKKVESKEITKNIFEKFYPVCLNLRQQTGFKLGKIIFKSVHKGFGGRLDLITCAGAPLDEKVAAFYYAMGFDVLITYGLTETNIPIIGNRGDNITIDSCGMPYPKMEVQIANPNETGEGEIYVRSPYMMKGYFRDSEGTQAAFDEEGWFKTGDLARLDAQGNVKITGRSKENIVLSTGKKVTPSDIENEYTAIPGIEELIISGVPVSGEHDEVHAFVVKEEAHLEEHTIIKAIQERGAQLSQYMKVAKIHFLEEIPKTSLQKPKRYLLKKHALEIGKEVAQTISQECEEVGLQDALKDTVGTAKDCQLKIEEKLQEFMIQITGLDAQMVRAERKVMSELGIDSLAAMEIEAKVEAYFKISIQDLLKQDVTLREMAHFIYKGDCEKQSTKEANEAIQVQDKKAWHYGLFKLTTLLAHGLYRVRVKNEEVLPVDQGYIVCANHVSNIDYLWIAQAFDKGRFGKFCCMAKKELFKGTWITNLLRDLTGMIPVERGAMNFEVMAACKQQLNKKWGLLIFPEGTRSQDGTLGAFKRGAATLSVEAGVPIVPVYIKGAHAIFPPGRKLPKFFNLEAKRRYEVEIVYGTPIWPNDLSAEELMNQVEASIKGLMGKVVEGLEETIEKEVEHVIENQEVSDLSQLLACDYEIDLRDELDA